MRALRQCPQLSSGLSSICLSYMVILALWLVQVQAMREGQIHELRKETEQLFYHGFDNYMHYAFPEDELRPLSCGSLTRDREHPEKIELNDVLGNYSLTLIDSLSTLGILASSKESGSKAWGYFENGVRDFVRLYGDGSPGLAGQGERARGFDLDSKVQVFETVIRGLGGLLSAHLFAVGDLPIRGYTPPEENREYARAWDKGSFGPGQKGIGWSNGFVYDGQLLRLARDLADRILPAFYTPTGLPYPRVNLRYGVPFFENSPLNKADSDGNADSNDRTSSFSQPREITETCSAGAGSLLLELTTLSRLIGDGRYEDLAKRAFWAVWLRRSDIDLIGAGIDAETGGWVAPYSGIGAGIDSFFEYAFKSHILLSSGERPEFDPSNRWSAMDNYFLPLEEIHHHPEAYLQVWEDAQDAIKHHVYRGQGYQHPHFVQADIQTGATRAFWIDSLSAFYPGVLTLAGKIEEATEIHLLATALWTRFAGLPERWNVVTGNIENGLGWWGGRPEFIESTYYLYRATKDPWYLHVGEMVLRDIKRRCWTRCGLAGLQSVLSGELQDRMESFFLGETAKYMYLLFDSDHPLNNIDSPFVFTTEGHPLIIPKETSTQKRSHAEYKSSTTGMCEIAPHLPPLGSSSTAARSDIFHAASLARLHLMEKRETGGALVEFSRDYASVTVSDLFSPSNYTFYPWTLPPELVPYNATSAPMSIRPTLDISFPNLPGMLLGPGSVERVRDGVFLKAIGGMRLGMVQDLPLNPDKTWPAASADGFRIQVINNVPLGKDEKVYLSREVTFGVLDSDDPNFARVQDSIMLDIVIDVEPKMPTMDNATMAIPNDHITIHHQQEATVNKPTPSAMVSSEELINAISRVSGMKTALSSLVSHVSSIIQEESTEKAQHPADPLLSQKETPSNRAIRMTIPAVNSIGLGSAPLPEVPDATIFSHNGKRSTDRLTWSNIYLADELCDGQLPKDVPRRYDVLIIKRGGCSFSDKIRNIPAFPHSRTSGLQLVILVSYEEHDNEVMTDTSTSSSFLDYHILNRPFTSTDPGLMQPKAAILSEPFLVRPHLDEPQFTTGGFVRRHPLGVIMVGGGEETYNLFRDSTGLGIRRRYAMKSQGVPIANLYMI
ncbi:glycosyl hydrolase family 47-domain-containing protein [Talaromyces proteolyticus]|uniref:alpha-1,2-Mannosidase n=1 Tax=Talaromyces proteolyticus TaxID=1131652 RepID=A0AAD4KJ93_9EURO|nr:glycosyl hydrolase family 47-domain-containing protein [Talaromyces proteolyticus]KAH8692422.1 glycosyl hydrolase family 47-domain-containing protein [Talaromyces proteolyticus]